MLSTLKRRGSTAHPPIGESLIPSSEPRATKRDGAGVIAWLAMLALAVAFLAAVGASALL